MDEEGSRHCWRYLVFWVFAGRLAVVGGFEIPIIYLIREPVCYFCDFVDKMVCVFSLVGTLFFRLKPIFFV